VHNEQEQEPVILQHPANPPPAPHILAVSTWQEAVNQWESGDPSKGLLILSSPGQRRCTKQTQHDTL
jgi:hypothetical protein